MNKPMTKRIPLELTNINFFRKDYIERFDIKEPEYLFRNKYGKYLRVICKCLKEYILEGHYLELPGKLGYFHILKKKRKSIFNNNTDLVKFRYVNWNETMKLRTKEREKGEKTEEEIKKIVIPYNVDSTDGNVFKIIIKIKPPLSKDIYFMPLQSFSRLLAKYIKKNINKLPSYYEYITKNECKFPYGTVEGKITAYYRDKQRRDFRKRLESDEANRIKTE